MRVERAGTWLHVIALRPAKTGASLIALAGELVAKPSRHSIQLDETRHIEVTVELPLGEMMTRYPWRFTNHSCDPNARLAGRALVALRPIAAGEEITYNYNTSEWELAEPFECRCGSPACERTIRGFRFLARQERERIKPMLAPHLLRRLDVPASRG